jgi:hypothetical protein
MAVLAHSITSPKYYGPAEANDDDILGPKQGMVDNIPEKYLQDKRNEHGSKGKKRYVHLKYFP